MPTTIPQYDTAGKILVYYPDHPTRPHYGPFDSEAAGTAWASEKGLPEGYAFKPFVIPARIRPMPPINE